MKAIVFFLLWGLCVVSADEHLLGGYTLQPINDKYVQEVVSEASAIFCKEHPQYIFKTVRKAANQIVAGTNYYLELEFETATQNFIVKMYVHKTLSNEVSITKIHSLTKSNRNVGEFSPLALDAEETTKIVDEVMNLLQKKYSNLKLISIEKAKKQIVAGTNYFLQIKCRNSYGSILWKICAYKSLDGKTILTKVTGFCKDLQLLEYVFGIMNKRSNPKCIVIENYNQGSKIYFAFKPQYSFLFKNIVIKPKTSILLMILDREKFVRCIQGNKNQQEDINNAVQRLMKISGKSQLQYKLKFLDKSISKCIAILFDSGNITSRLEK